MTAKKTVDLKAELLDLIQETCSDYMESTRLKDPDGMALVIETTVDDILTLITKLNKDLLGRVRSEVIVRNDEETCGGTQNPDNPIYWTRRTRNRNEIRDEQRLALQKIEDSL